jgi:hypothetical protein
MIRFNVLYIGVIALLGGCCGLVKPSISPELMKLPCKLLSVEYAPNYAKKIDTLIEYGFVTSYVDKMLADEEDPTTLEYLVWLWCQGHRRFVELEWWKKDDRLTRILIMMLILSDLEDDMIDGYIWLCDNTFSRVEGELRKEEIFLIAKKRKEYSILVHSLEDCVRAIQQSASLNK